jgi:hypothetical protein
MRVPTGRPKRTLVTPVTLNPMHQLYHSRRRIPDGSSFTKKKVAQQRRMEMAAFVLSALPAATLLDCMSAPRPPSIYELIQLAQQHAAEIPCPHCGKPLPKGD